jgi:hypothetical protein
MAQTKTARSNSKSTSKRTSRNGSRANGSPSKSGAGRSRSRGKTAAASSARNRSSSSARRKSGSRGSRSRSGAPAKRAATSTVAKALDRAKGPTVVKALDRAKVPAIAGGAALVGFAGGLALKNGRKRGGFGSMPRPQVNLRMPKPKGSAVKILGGAAKEIAKGGYKIGQLTSEVQKVRQAVDAQDSGK